MHGNGPPPSNESVRVCRELMLRLIHLPFIYMHKNKPFHWPTLPSQSSFNGTLSRRPSPRRIWAESAQKFSCCCCTFMFVTTPVKSLAVGADVIHPRAKLTSCCTLLRFFMWRWMPRSRVFSIELQEPGNESIVHHRDEPGD